MRDGIHNAIIESAVLTRADHEILSAWLDLDYGGSAQGFGGYALYLPKSSAHHRLESVAGHFIFRILEIADVQEWSKLKGKAIRVQITDGLVMGIGHVVRDDWFFPAQDFKKLADSEDASGGKK